MKPQRQDSLNEQLRDLVDIAQHEGMYDAADFLIRFLEKAVPTNSEK